MGRSEPKVGKFKRIEIVNDSDDLIMTLGADNYGKDAEIRMYSSDGHELVVLFTRPGGECGISILSKTGQVKASICSREGSHGLVVYDGDGELAYDAVWPDLPSEEE